jgi:hypothetical protein
VAEFSPDERRRDRARPSKPEEPPAPAHETSQDQNWEEDNAQWAIRKNEPNLSQGGSLKALATAADEMLEDRNGKGDNALWAV